MIRANGAAMAASTEAREERTNQPANVNHVEYSLSASKSSSMTCGALMMFFCNQFDAPTIHFIFGKHRHQAFCSGGLTHTIRQEENGPSLH